MSGTEPRVDFTLKTIIIGETAAGKSSLLAYFVSGKPSDKISRHTVGVEFASRTIAVPSNLPKSEGSNSVSDTSIVKLQCWDTAGSERFRSVTRSYYRGAVCCMIVFALNDRASYEKLPQWLHDAKHQAGDQVTIVIVGNKADLPEERQVSVLEASNFAQTNGCAYIETSAMTGDNVEAAFFKLARSVITKVEEGRIDASVVSASGGAVAVKSAAATPEAGGCSC